MFFMLSVATITLLSALEYLYTSGRQVSVLDPLQAGLKTRLGLGLDLRGFNVSLK